jgi:Mn-containing catalase
MTSRRRIWELRIAACPRCRPFRELFTELRDEEAEHVEMLKAQVAKLPESAKTEFEYDVDETPAL